MFDAAFLSHVVFWVIGATTLGGIVLGTAAMISMGRAGNRED